MAKLFLIVVILVLAFGQFCKPFEAELSNHSHISKIIMSGSCRVGIVHRAAGQVAQASAKTNDRTVTSAPQLNRFPPRFSAAAS